MPEFPALRCNPFLPKGGVALLALGGLYLSLRLVLSQAFLDPDSSHSLVLWQGLREHGLSWLSSWRFTQDNWLLALFPLHFLGYAIFGAEPAVPLLSGWLIFVGAAMMSGVLAWQCGAHRAAPLLAALLLFAGVEAHLRGLLAYSTTHNSSNLFGLFALALVLAWLRNGGLGKLVASCLLLSAAALSDPWLLPAYNLPLLLLALSAFAWPRLGIERRQATALFVIALLSIVVARTYGFGLLDLPSMEYNVGGWEQFPTKIALLLREAGALLQFIPFVMGMLGAYLSCAALALVLLPLLYQSVARGLLRETVTAALVVFTVFSTAGICGAFLLSETQGSSFELGARLLINAFYLIAVVLTVLAERHWHELPLALRAALPVMALGFVVNGILSTAPARQSESWHFDHRHVAATLAFLQDHGLSYGYGTYWGAAANAVTALSDGAVIVRPVSFDAGNGRVSASWRPQSSSRWYAQADLPAGQREVFILLTATPNDEGECPALDLCERALEQQFGAPIRALPIDDTRRVLVWDHPLPELWLND